MRNLILKLKTLILLSIFLNTSCAKKCSNFFTLQTRTLDLKGLTGSIKGKTPVDLGLGELTIKPEFVKVSEELYRLDLLQYQSCMTLRDIKNKGKRDDELIKRNNAIMSMMEIANSPEKTNKNLKIINVQSLSAVVTYELGGQAFVPEIFRNSPKLNIRIIDFKSLDSSKIKGWKNDFIISNKALEISSIIPQFDKNEVVPTVDGYTTYLKSRYTGFSGQLKGIQDTLNRNSAAFEGLIRVSEIRESESSIWLENLQKNKDSDFYKTFEDFCEKYEITEERKKELQEFDYRVIVYPIEAKLQIYDAGDLVGESIGIVVRVYEHDDDVRNLFVIKFPVTKFNY